MTYKILITFLTAVSICSNVQAAMSTDFGNTREEAAELNAQDLKNRLELVGEVYVLDSSGERLLRKSAEERKWRPSDSGVIESNWHIDSNEFDPISIYHRWEILKDGRIKVLIEQYDRMNRKGFGPVVKGKLLKRDEFVLKDFAPLSIHVLGQMKNLVVIRFTPDLLRSKPKRELANFPIVGFGATIYDKRGNVWATNIDMNGKFIGIVTYKGALLLSYAPFDGAMEAGSSKDKSIVVHLDNTEVILQSESNFLPKNVIAKVYGAYISNLKTDRLNSVRMIESSDEPTFLKNLKLH